VTIVLLNNEQDLNNYISPLNTLSQDPGDETQLRFRYQHTFTTLVALTMYSGKVPYKELYCEHHEDILAVEETGNFHGIQIKTRQLKDGPFELNDQAIKGSLLRFVEHDLQFVGSFTKFVIVSNCPCRDDNTGKSLINLLKQVKRGITQNFKPRDLNKFIQDLARDGQATVENVIDMLKKTDFLEGPGLNDIDSKIINEHLGKLSECNGVGIEKLRIIHRRLCEKMHQASSKLLESGLKDYAALAGGMPSIIAEEINIKRITKQMIGKLVAENINSSLFLSSRSELHEILPASSSQLMRYKMSSGFIDSDDIEIIDDLRSEAEVYFISNSYKTEDRTTYLRELHQIKKIVINESRESKSRLKKENNPYGSEMLHD
jgi:hypothetical protein